MSDTILRHLTMLSLVPAYPRKIAAGELHARLTAQGFETHLRSVERDLHKIGGKFGLICDDAKPAGWSWATRDAQLTFPPMNTEAALTYELLSRYLPPILPRSMSRQLEPEFAKARRALEYLRDAPIGRWMKRIAVLPNGHQLLPPEVKSEVSEVVYEALLQCRRFEADYHAADKDKASRYPFNPQGLVYRQGVLYLVATLWDYTEVRQFALHRMANATLLEDAALVLKGFDLQHYIEDEKGFDLPAGKTIMLELRVAPWLARHLGECWLAKDQVIEAEDDDESCRVSATLAETELLYWWLRSLGPDVEVLKPLSLRRRIARDLKAAAKAYA